MPSWDEIINKESCIKRNPYLAKPIYKTEKIEKDNEGIKFYFTNDPLSSFKNKIIPKKIIYNGPATIVFWNDGTKTIVKRSEKDTDNKYNAFCAALAKKIYGSNSKITSIVNSGKEE